MAESVTVEQHVKAIKNGSPVPVEDRIDITPKEKHDFFVPQTKSNICYIVGSIIFDEKGQVLLIQEAKKSCRGLWYIPAGRLEPGETLIDGAKRELLEESGLVGDLTTLLAVETNGTWQRYTFTGKITGGKLKTEKEEDGESIQAKFFSLENLQSIKKNIRASDVFKLVDVGRKHYAKSAALSSPSILPVIAPQKYPTLRVVVLDRSTAEHSPMHILTSVIGGQRLPSTIMLVKKPNSSLTISIFAILNEAISDRLAPGAMRICGVLGLEHRGTRIGKNEDGICTTVLVCLDLQGSCPPPAVYDTSPPKYKWCPISDADIINYLIKATQGALIPMV